MSADRRAVGHVLLFLDACREHALPVYNTLINSVGSAVLSISLSPTQMSGSERLLAKVIRALLERQKNGVKELKDNGDDGGGEKCQCCGERYLTVYRLPDTIWDSIIGHKTRAGLLCPVCADEKAREAGITLYWEAAQGEFPTYLNDSRTTTGKISM